MNVCIIPARGGSKRIPKKNIRDFCGKPMIEWVLDATLPLEPLQFIVVYGTHSTALTEKYADG